MAQAAYVAQRARPSLIDIKGVAKRQSKPMYAMPPTWNAPPTPPDDDELFQDLTVAAPTLPASPMPLSSHPPLAPLSSTCGKIVTPNGRRDSRMRDWLAHIPPPVTPQERYEQGLDSRVDHPLHPRPLQVNAARQNQVIQKKTKEIEPKADKNLFVRVDAADKENQENQENQENIIHHGKLSAFGIVTELDNNNDDLNDNYDQYLNDRFGRKRPILEEHADGLAKKRAKMLDPVRRFSQRVSTSLTLPMEEDDMLNGELSPEDAARESALLYRSSRSYGHRRQTSKTSKRNFRLSLSKAPGSLRTRSSTTIRRMMPGKVPAPEAPLAGTLNMHDSPVDLWSDGRPDMIVNVAFIGDARVGKTALIRRLVYGTFPPSYEPSGIQQQTIRLMVDDTRVELNLSEGGSARNPNEPSVLALGWYSVVVLCFDVGHKNTLQNLQKYRNEVGMYEENSVILLAGLKKDARHRLPPLQLSYVEEPSQVSAAKGVEAARQMNCTDYFECSSLGECDGVDGLFDYIVQSGVELQRSRDKKMARFRMENSVDKSMSKIADGVRSLFLFRGN